MAHANSNVAAVAYYRMSSDQQEASIPAQRKAVERFAKEHGYNILREYRDEGISGWKEEREGFQRLITDLARGDFQAVLCWDQNRFSRFPVLEANHYWYLLDRAGVHLTTVNQGKLDWTSIAGWITASIKQHGDAQHRFQLSADVKRGMRAVAERGEWQGAIPFGYAIQNRKLAIGNPSEVEVIRRIFRDYLTGHSIRSITEKLNTERIGAGEMWCLQSVRNKLANPVYAGIFRRQDIELLENHPAIIKTSEFNKVQRLLAERQTKTTPKRNGGSFLFSSLLRCGKCGSPMSGRTLDDRTFYCCDGQKSKGSSFCDRNHVKQVELTEHVIGAIEQRFYNHKVVKRLRDELHRQVAVTTTKVNPERLRKQLAVVADKMAKAKRRLVECDSDMLATVQEAIRGLRNEHEQLEAAIKATSTPKDVAFQEVDEKIDAAMKAFGALRETLRKADPVRLRELLRQTIGKIEVWAEKELSTHVFQLQRGVIHLRADNLSNSPGRK